VCDAKAPGLQSTVERLFSDILVTLSGPQYLHCAFGLFDGNSTFCPLQAVLDDVHFQMIRFFLRPPMITPQETDIALKQLREVVDTQQKLYISHIRPMLRSGQLSMPYPFEAAGETDDAMALAHDRMQELLEKPVDHIDQAVVERIFREIPGLLPRLNVYAERKNR
jgi:trimethylamine:corrinoid methyltransferase-like protein